MIPWQAVVALSSTSSRELFIEEGFQIYERRAVFAATRYDIDGGRDDMGGQIRRTIFCLLINRSLHRLEAIHDGLEIGVLWPTKLVTANASTG